MEEKICDISMTIESNGGFIICYTRKYKPEYSGEMANMTYDYKREPFSPKDAQKAYARIEELRTKAMTEEEDD
jgi:hypothetical protein